MPKGNSSALAKFRVQLRNYSILMASLNTIKNWFKSGLKPNQAQFWETWDSFWHKDDRIPVAQIDGVDALLDQKANKSNVDNHLVDAQAHAAIFAQKEDMSKKGQANGYAPLNQAQKIASQYLEIINDLTTGGSTNLLSAAMGKQLQTQLAGIQTLLQSNDMNMDNVQELVDAIKSIQYSLSAILVNDLTSGGVTKALTAEMGKYLSDNKVNKSLIITINGTSFDLSANRSWNITTSGVPYSGATGPVDLGAFDLLVNGILIGARNGWHNTFMGYNAGQNSTSNTNENVGVGALALFNCNSIQNTGVGNRVLYSCIGFGNVGVGNDSLLALTSGNNNVGIGANTSVPSPTGNNQLNIGGWIYGKDGRIMINGTLDDGVNHLQVNGSLKATQFRLSALNTAPASATAAGTPGEIRVTSGFIYVCIATNTWVRSALTTF